MSMFISIVGSGKNKYVYLLRSFRKDGKVCTQKVESFGKLSDLIKDDPDAVNKLKLKYADDKTQVMQAATAKAHEIISGSLAPAEKTRALGQPLLHYGHYLLKAIWDDELKLNKTFYYLNSICYPRSTIDLNQVLLALIYLKIATPQSIYMCYAQKATLLGAPFEELSIDQLYNCLDVLNEHKDLIMSRVNRQLDKILDRKYRMIFYDVTNVYFESPLTDEERNYLRGNCAHEVKQILEKAIKDGLITLTEGETVNTYNLLQAPASIQAELRQAMYFKTKGPSKEHRFDLPLVSVALIVDEHAIPVDFQVYSGCASEFKTMPKSIKSFKDKYHVEQVIVVADRGLNSTANLDMLIREGYGFIVAQKVTSLDENTYSQLFSPEGYVEYTNQQEDEVEGLVRDRLRRKVLPYTKYDRKTGLKVDCSLVITHSELRERRDRKQLEHDLRKAVTAVQSNEELPLSKSSWLGLVRKPRKRRKEDENRSLELNFEAVEKAEKLCGYSALVYRNAPQAQNEGLSDEEIASSYHHLVQIEDCFRVLKNNLKLRPMYVWTEPHIKGHVTACVLALILLRRMQMRVSQNNQELSLNEIQKGLEQAKVSLQLTTSKDGTAVIHKLSEYSDLYRGKEKLNPQQIKQIIEEAENYQDLTDKLVEAIGLVPLPQSCDRFTLAKCLGTRFSHDHDLVDSGVYYLHTGQWPEDMVS